MCTLKTHIILRQFDSRRLGKGQLFVQNMSKCHVKRKQIFISLLFRNGQVTKSQENDPNRSLLNNSLSKLDLSQKTFCTANLAIQWAILFFSIKEANVFTLIFVFLYPCILMEVGNTNLKASFIKKLSLKEISIYDVFLHFYITVLAYFGKHSNFLLIIKSLSCFDQRNILPIDPKYGITLYEYLRL